MGEPRGRAKGESEGEVAKGESQGSEPRGRAKGGGGQGGEPRGRAKGGGGGGSQGGEPRGGGQGGEPRGRAKGGGQGGEPRGRPKGGGGQGGEPSGRAKGESQGGGAEGEGVHKGLCGPVFQWNAPYHTPAHNRCCATHWHEYQGFPGGMATNSVGLCWVGQAATTHPGPQSGPMLVLCSLHMAHAFGTIVIAINIKRGQPIICGDSNASLYLRRGNG